MSPDLKPELHTATQGRQQMYLGVMHPHKSPAADCCGKGRLASAFSFPAIFLEIENIFWSVDLSVKSSELIRLKHISEEAWDYQLFTSWQAGSISPNPNALPANIRVHLMETAHVVASDYFRQRSMSSDLTMFEAMGGVQQCVCRHALENSINQNHMVISSTVQAKWGEIKMQMSNQLIGVTQGSFPTVWRHMRAPQRSVLDETNEDIGRGRPPHHCLANLRCAATGRYHGESRWLPEERAIHGGLLHHTSQFAGRLPGRYGSHRG